VTARATSRSRSYHDLTADQRLRRYVGAVAGADWKLAQRLVLSAPGGDRVEPGFVRRVDALRRLTYRVLLVALSAVSWAAPAAESSARVTVPWSPLETRALEGDEKVLRRRLQAACDLARDRVRAAAELWAAFDRFCTEMISQNGASVVSAFSPQEHDWLATLVARADQGELDAQRIDDALRTMKSFWERFIGSDEEPVLVLD
jgi:hypothetical protein